MNEPAYPVVATITHQGLTKLELFAAMAMMGILANKDLGTFEPQKIAKWSLDQATALLCEIEEDRIQC